MKYATLVLIAVLVVAAIVVDQSVNHGSKAPTASHVGTVAHQAHDACGKLTATTLTSALGTPISSIRALHAASAISSSWEQAPDWSGCIWLGYDAKTKQGGSLQLAIAELATPAAAEAKFEEETAARRAENGSWHRVTDLGNRASLLDQSTSNPTGEIAVLRGDFVFAIQYQTGARSTSLAHFRETLKQLAETVLRTTVIAQN